MKGFDISYWQKNYTASDFKKAKEAKWEFVIIRTSYNVPAKLDSKFENNYAAAIKAGMKVGVYHYSKATSIAKAESEAKSVLDILKKRTLHCPVFIDCEDAVQRNLGKTRLKNICEAFCKVIENAGYAAGVYASYDFLTNRMDRISDKYMVWLAQYPKATYKGRYEMHQYSSSGKVPGIGQPIDVNTASGLKYGTYPVTKKSETETKSPAKSSTSTKKAETKTSTKKVAKKKVTEAIINAVIAGKYGVGDARKKKLESAGYNYKEVQSAVSLRLVARDVIAGKYGNGLIRKLRLRAKGFDPAKVQAEVNRISKK